MSANISFIRQKEGDFFSVKKPAWHNLGTVVDNALNSKEAIVNAGLDFEVTKEDIYFEICDDSLGINIGTSIPIPDYFATVRQDNKSPLGVVKNRYEVLQNKEAFDFFDDIVGSKRAIFHTAGSIDGGKIIFITAKLPKSIIMPDSAIDNYLLLTNRHDGLASLQVLFTPIRVVCNNTLQAALNAAKTKVIIRHSKSIKNNLKEAERILGISNWLIESTENIMKTLNQFEIVDVNLREYICSVFLSKKEFDYLLDKTDILSFKKIGEIESIDDPNKPLISTRKLNIIKDVYLYSTEHPTQKKIKHNLYGAYNGVVGYFQNMKSYKDEQSKLKAISFDGNVQNVSNIALNNAYQLIN